MSLTPVEVRHLALRRGLFGYRRSDVSREIEQVADSFEAVWRERAELTERVHVLETEVARHVELETLLRSTLVSAERAAQDMKESTQSQHAHGWLSFLPPARWLAQYRAAWLPADVLAGVGELAVELKFHVTGTLEFFKDHLIHFGSRVNQCRGNDGQRSSVFHVSGRTEKSFWLVKGVGVDTTRKDLSRRRHDRIISAGKPGNGVKQDHDVVTTFHHTLGFFEYNAGDLHMALSLLHSWE